MAKIIGDTNQVGGYLRVLTEKKTGNITIRGFKATRKADGRSLTITPDEMRRLLGLLHRAEVDLHPTTTKRG